MINFHSLHLALLIIAEKQSIFSLHHRAFSGGKPNCCVRSYTRSPFDSIHRLFLAKRDWYIRYVESACEPIFVNNPRRIERSDAAQRDSRRGKKNKSRAKNRYRSSIRSSSVRYELVLRSGSRLARGTRKCSAPVGYRKRAQGFASDPRAQSMINKHRLISAHLVTVSDVSTEGRRRRKRGAETKREREREMANDRISRPRGPSFCVLQCEKTRQKYGEVEPRGPSSATMASNSWDRAR